MNVAIGKFFVRGVFKADQVTKAEVKMAMRVAKKNISLALCEQSAVGMFPGSAIARKYSSGGQHNLLKLSSDSILLI